jgi:hypothetical protein
VVRTSTAVSGGHASHDRVILPADVAFADVADVLASYCVS